MFFKLGWMTLLAFVWACAPATQGPPPVRDPAALPHRTVVLLPLTGLPVHAPSAGEWAAHLLNKQPFLNVLGPIELELALSDRGMGVPAAIDGPADASPLAAELGADLVVAGRLFFENGRFGLEAGCEFKIFDAQDGRPIDTVSARQFLHTFLNENKYVMQAVEKAIQAFLGAYPFDAAAQEKTGATG